MAWIADTMQVGDACVEIIRDDEASYVYGEGVDCWVWVVSVPGCECVAYSEHSYIGAFDDMDLVRDALAAATIANNNFKLTKG